MNTLERAFVSERRCLHHINVEVCCRSFLVAIRRLRERALRRLDCGFLTRCSLLQEARGQ
jgi:hypothetical protein